MRGYESILESSPHGEPGSQGAHEESGERSALRGAGERGHGTEARRRNVAAVSVGALTLLGVLLGLSGTTRITKDELARSEDQQQQDDVAADLSSKHHHHGHHADAFVSVFESSLYTGARLDQGFPSPAGLKEECARPSESDDDSDDDSSEGSSDDDGDDGGGKGATRTAPCPGKGRGTVVVESHEKLQKMIGFGGAFTDAATINFYKLPTDIQDKVMDAYFGPNGIEYTVGRIPMGSCDFSVEEYSFDDVPGDYNLTHFDNGVEKDSAQRIPMILEALKRREDLKLFTSPWSPPAWMKVPLDGEQSMIKSAAPEGLLPDPRVHAAWALFFSKFITAYKEQGVDMWGLTIQNESENSGPWEACVYTPSSQANFIRDYLGPVIRRDHPDVKIMAFDHNRDHLVKWTKEMVRDKETSQYVDGMAFHWYFASGERLLDGSTGWGNLNTTHNLLSDDQFILSTENCNCPNVQHSLEGGWKRAEHVAHDMIADVNSWSTGWIDWNLMLSYDGGPNHLGNLCDSPVVADKNHTDVIFQPMFYFLGHMSKFAQPGARRLKSHVTGSYQKGGMGPSTAVPGYEATLYGCESSVRQSWELSATGKISLADRYGAQYDWFSPMCISKEVSANSHSVSLVPCDSDQAGTFIHDPESLHLVLQTDDSDPPDAYTPVVPDAEAGPGEPPSNGSESGPGQLPVNGSESGRGETPLNGSEPRPEQPPLNGSESGPRETPLTASEPGPEQPPFNGSESGPRETPLNASEPGPEQPPVNGSEPGPGQLPVNGTESGPGKKPLNDSESGPGETPLNGSESGPEQPPVNGSESGHGETPLNGSESGPGETPLNGSESGSEQPPVNGSESEPEQPPVNGSESGPGETPLNGGESGPEQPPVNGSDSGPGEPPLNGSESGRRLTTAAAAPALCLAVLGGSVDDGALLTLAPCVNDTGKGSQSWEFPKGGGDAGEGSLVSLSTGQCVTAGWPFFTGAAFEMSKDSRERYGKDFAVVLLNEAEEPVEFDLSFPSEEFTVRVAIGGRSIQTILA